MLKKHHFFYIEKTDFYNAYPLGVEISGLFYPNKKAVA